VGNKLKTTFKTMAKNTITQNKTTNCTKKSSAESAKWNKIDESSTPTAKIKMTKLCYLLDPL